MFTEAFVIFVFGKEKKTMENIIHWTLRIGWLIPLQIDSFHSKLFLLYTPDTSDLVIENFENLEARKWYFHYFIFYLKLAKA